MLYLISSNSYNLIDDEIHKIYKDKVYDVIDFSKIDSDILLEEFGYNDLFGTEKNLVIRNSTFFEPKGNVDTKKIEKFLENPNESVNVIFTCNGVDERKKVTKLMKDKFKVNIIKNLTNKDIVSRLVNICNDKEFILNLEDANFISNSSLNNYDIAYINLTKIFLYYGEGTKILHDDVVNLCSISLEDNNFKFVDNVVNKNVEQSFKILNDFKIQKVEPLALFNLLAREFRLMLLLKNEYSKDNSKNNLIKKSGLMDWQVDKLLREANNYSVVDLENKLLSIFEYDYKIKSGKINKFLALELFILE